MTDEKTIMARLRQLPEDKKREALHFIEFLHKKHIQETTKPRSSMGVLSHLGVVHTEEDLKEARRDMWEHSRENSSERTLV